MKTQIVRHGEVILKPITSLPKEAVLEKETNEYIVAHSETGHHHVLATKEKTEVQGLFLEWGNLFGGATNCRIIPR